jgi:multiple sugar transport system ATP-binding protein
MMMAPGVKSALRLVEVSKAYGKVRALDRLSIEVAEGRFFVLFGPSSVGKTTTLRLISGLVRPDFGRLDISGVDHSAAPIKGRGVAMVFQSFALYPHLTVKDNLAYPLVEARIAAPAIASRVSEMAEMLRLGHRLERKPNTLSGGEQQRVALGRALIQRPRILLLDEPLTNLDAKLRHDMRAELKRLHRQFGMTIVYATPDELEALSMGEEIAVMRDGRVVQTGTPDDLYDAPADIYVASKIGSPHMNLLDGTADGAGRTIVTPLGAFEIGNRASAVASGERLVLGIRPSDIRVADRDAIETRVQLVEPQGDVTVISLASGEAILRLILPEQKASGYTPGDLVRVALDRDKVHLFRRHDGSAIR